MPLISVNTTHSFLLRRVRALGLASAALLSIYALAGCANATATMAAGLGLLNLTTISATGKSLFDHTTEAYISSNYPDVVEVDCSVIRYTERGSYCIDLAKRPLVTSHAPVYCYRTIGNVECYREPDTRRTTRPLEDAPAPLAIDPVAAMDPAELQATISMQPVDDPRSNASIN
jgi:hypothetical protein